VNGVDELLDGLEGLRPWHEAFYQDLHRNPELSYAETRTAGLIADRLAELGYEVHPGIGPTGLVGVLRNGDGRTVLARADMDALPVLETTDLPYRSTATVTGADGRATPVMHACGHDMHVTCLLAVAQLLADHVTAWTGTFIALFQPAEEVGSGARSMVDGGLADVIPTPDVALGQHVMGLPYDTVGARSGPAMSAADSIRITVHGRGSHGSMPHAGVDPIVLASTIVLRLNMIVSRELPPGDFGVVTVGSFQAGSKSNIIPGQAVLLVNVRSYDERTRARQLAAIERIVDAECAASGSPQPAEFEYYDRFPLTENTPAIYDHVSAAFAAHFGDKAIEVARSTGSEDFSDIPNALGVPFLFWFWGGFHPDVYAQAEREGRLSEVIPANHNGNFAPVMAPTMRTGITAMTVATMSYLGRESTGAYAVHHPISPTGE
jgi:amidohydrolase